MNKLNLLLCIAFCGISLSVHADDEAQTNLRLNPEIENASRTQCDYSEFTFLNTDANVIRMNGTDWSDLCRKYRAAADGDTVFNVVYLGDSHIQADFGGSVLRSRLAEDAGSAGRGIIIPFKLAGTNQPVDYTMQSNNAVTSSRLLKQPWVTAMPYTGIGVTPVNGRLKVDITVNEPFDSLSLVYTGENDVTFHGSQSCVMTFSHPVTEAAIDIDVPEGSAFGGVVLGNGKKGVCVHSIGNNGAQYSSYANVSGFGEGIASLNPDLIIVALGTNEAFGNFSTEIMKAEMEALLTSLSTYCPDAKLLLVTPTECMRKRFRGRGRRRAAGLTVNTNVAQARRVVADYATENGIPLYDTYTVAGGTGASSKMKNAGVLGRDGVHFTATGYKMWGSLLADALIEQLRAQ